MYLVYSIFSRYPKIILCNYFRYRLGIKKRKNKKNKTKKNNLTSTQGI